MYKNSITHYIAKYMVDIMFFGGIICILGIPYITEWLFKMDIIYIGRNVYTAFMAILFISGICAEYLLFNLRTMFKTLIGKNPFVPENVTCLRKCAATCAVIALIYFAKLFFMFTIATIIIVLVFVIGCLFCLTLKDLFKQAIAFKEENELTI